MPFPKEPTQTIDWEARGVFSADNTDALDRIREAGHPYTFANHLEGHPGPFPVTIVLGTAALSGSELSTK